MNRLLIRCRNLLQSTTLRHHLLSQMSTSQISTSSVSEILMHKNRLQQYTQKSGIPLPVYQTVNEGSSHEPKFRCTVLVNGGAYTGPATFLHRKTAEQDAARQALQYVTKSFKDKGCPLIQEDIVFCKAILNEYAVKMKQDMPVYTTVQQKGLHPIFFSSLVFNGVTFTGDAGKNKKEAEQLAARAAILSLQGDKSESATVLSEIIQCKHKLYAAHLVKSSDNVQKERSSVGVSVSEGEKAAPSSSNEGLRQLFLPRTAISEPCSGQIITHPEVPHQSFHIFKSPKAEPASESIPPPPIVFVPSTLEQSLGVSSNSGKKRNRKNKKKAGKKSRTETQMEISAPPVS